MKYNIPDEIRILKLSERQAILLHLAALEDYLGLPRSVKTRVEKRKEEQRTGDESI